MHRVGNSTEIKPNWDSLEEDDSSPPLGGIILKITLYIGDKDGENRDTAMTLYTSVDVPCSCEIRLLGDNAPPAIVQNFIEPVTGHRTDFVDLTPNSNYTVIVTASASDYADNQKSQSKVTDPITPEYTLTTQLVEIDRVVIKAEASVDCTLTYSNKVVGSSDTPPSDSIVLVENRPVLVEINSLIGDTVYYFEGTFTPTNNSIESGTRFLIYTTLPVPDPEYTLTLMSVGDDSAIFEARSLVDCTLEYSNRLTTEGAFTFTGDPNSYLNATSRTGLVGGGTGFTLSAWVYRTRSGYAWDRVIDFGNGQGLDNIFLCFQDGMLLYTGADRLEVNLPFPESTWTHVAVVQSRTGDATTGPATIYWDGVVVVSTDSMKFPPLVSRSGLYVGKSHWVADPLFTGSMRDLLVWDIALTTAELDAVRLGGDLPTSTAPLVSIMRTPPTDTVSLIENVPAIIYVNELSMATEYLFSGQFTPNNDAVAAGKRELQYTTTFTMQIVPQPAASPPHAGIVALPVVGKESTQLMLNVSCNGRGIAEMHVYNATAGGPIKNLAISEEASQNYTLVCEGGYPREGYIDGNNDFENITLEECAALAATEEGCRYFFWGPDGKTCSRYIDSELECVDINYGATYEKEQYFITGFTADGFQLVTGLQPSTDYKIFVVKLFDENGKSFTSDVSIDYRTADVNVTNELTLQVLPLDDTEGEDGTRPGETSFSFQVGVTQDSTCTYSVTDPNNSEEIVALGSVIVSGGNSRSVPVTGLTSNTLYNCSVVAISEYPTTQKQVSVTTLPQVGDIYLALSLENAPFPQNDTALWLYVTVDIACTCEIVLMGENAPPRFSETFDAPVTGYRFDFINLAPNSTYACVVVARANNYNDNEKTTSKVTDPPFPILTAFQLQSPPASTLATVTANLNRPGSVIFHLEAVDDPDYIREDVDAIITQQNLDYDYWDGYQHRFFELTGSKTYRCICTAVQDPSGNSQTRDDQFLFTTAPPISVSATLTAPAAPQGRTSLVAEANATKPASLLQLVLTSDNGESYTQNYAGSNASVTHTFESLVPDTLYTLNVNATDFEGGEATAVDSASTLPPPLAIGAFLSTPADNGDTSLIANFQVNRISFVRLTLLEISDAGGVYTQEFEDVTTAPMSHTFTGLTPSTLYQLTATATANSDGAQESAENTRSTLEPPPPFDLAASLTVPQENGDTSLVTTYQVNHPSSLQLFLFKNETNEQVQYEQFDVNDINVPLAFRFFYLDSSTRYDLQARAVSNSDGSVVVKNDTATTSPTPVDITAYLANPPDNADTVLLVNFSVTTASLVNLKLTTTGGETHEQDYEISTTNVEIGTAFAELTPETVYTLTATATTPDGNVATVTDTKSTQATPSIPFLISVDILSDDKRPPARGSSPTADGHIQPLEGQYGEWNSMVTQGGQQIYELNNLKNGLQEVTSIGVVVNANRAQHYTYGYYEGGSKSNAGEDVIGLATPQNTGSLVECYFTGLDDSKLYTVRMFGQHLDRAGDGSINFGRFGVNGDKKNTGPNSATCSWYSVSPAQGRINFSLEYINPSSNNEYASLGGFQLQEEVSAVRDAASDAPRLIEGVRYPLQINIGEDFLYNYGKGRLVITSAAIDSADVNDITELGYNLFLFMHGIHTNNRITTSGAEHLSETNVVAKFNKQGVYIANDAYYDIYVPEEWRGSLRFHVMVENIVGGQLVMRDLSDMIGRAVQLTVDFHFQ